MALGETISSIGSSIVTGASNFGIWTINTAIPTIGSSIAKTAVLSYNYFFQPLGAGLFHLGKLACIGLISGGKWLIALIAANPVISSIVAGIIIIVTTSFFLGRYSKRCDCPHCIKNPRVATATI